MERPTVIVAGTVSVDGRLTLAPGVLLMFGDERWQAVAGESDIANWLMMLHQPQAYFEGSGSLAPARCRSPRSTGYHATLSGRWSGSPSQLIPELVPPRHSRLGRAKLPFALWTGQLVLASAVLYSVSCIATEHR